MARTFPEYLEWLGRRNLIWPQVPPRVDPKARPYTKRLKGIRAVTWSIYGTLLRITDGELLHEHPQQLRMQVALEKTVQEFNMWHSMYRTPESPSAYMHRHYQQAVEGQRMAPTKHKGDTPEVNSAGVWLKLIRQLQLKEYAYDREFYGDEDELSEKVAYFFHANLQGVETSPRALATLRAIREAGYEQGLLADAQSFTLVQMLRAFGERGKLPAVGELFHPGCMMLSFQHGVRTPSRSLYTAAVEHFARRGIPPEGVLHVGCRLRDDLAAARRSGLRTVLYAGDQASLRATKGEVRDPNIKPDRLVTDLDQIREILDIP